MRNQVLLLAACAGLASVPLYAGTLLPGGILTITFATSPMPNQDPVQGLMLGWGNLASESVTGSPTFTVKLYDGTTWLDTETTTPPLDYVCGMVWSDTGNRSYGGAVVAHTPIDFAPVNAGTFAGKVEVTIDQGSVGDIITGDVSPYLGSWDPLNIELLSYLSDGAYGDFAPDINVSLGDESGTVPEPGSFGLMGLGVLVFATWRHRRSRGHAPCHLPAV
jgi:hypothetical protein